MGEARRRKHEIEKQNRQHQIWRESLNEQEREILNLAILLDEKLVRGMKFYEGCYHITFFMSKHLQEMGIFTNPKVGWVNDGDWDGVASHAWIEYSGKKTDVSLGYTLRPDAQPTGNMLVHDRTIRKGMATYQYFENDDPEAIKRLARLSNDPQYSQIVSAKEIEHKYMLSVAESREFDSYLSKAPSGLQYNDICKLINT